jgi:hypothetical protein
MAATGFTPILLYASGTAAAVPTTGNLSTSSTNGAELALNYADGKLYYKDGPSGSIQVLASKATGTIAGSTTQVIYNNAGVYAGSANFTFNGTIVTLANDASISGLVVGKGGGAVATNTALGLQALNSNSSGANNTAVGYQAGSSLSTGSNNILIGSGAAPSIVTVSNENTFGNSSTTSNRFWGDLKMGGSSAGTSGQVLISGGAGVAPSWGASGTVTGVTATSPVASSGGTAPVISLSAGYGDTLNPYASKTANFILAAPTGVAGVPTFRAMVVADVPTLNQNTTGSAATLTTARNLWGQSFNGSADISAPLYPALGTVSLPAYSASGDTNTGMYFPAADTIAFTGGGVESMRIDSSGILNLTNNPILSAGTANGITYLNASKSLTTSSALTFDGTNTLLLNATGNAIINLDGSGTNNAILRLRNATTGNLAGIFANNSKELIFEANGAVEQMRLTSTGLGIGTSSPGVELDVVGTIRSSSAAVASASTITPTAGTTNQYNVTALAVPATIAAPSGTPIDGQKLTIRIEDDGTARALTWTTTSGAYRVIGTTLPTTTTASKTIYVGCIYNSTDVFWDVVAVATQA